MTATFVEQNIFTVVITGATVLYGGKYLERAWGSREFAKFIFVVALVPNIVMVFLYILWSSIVSDSTIAYVFLFFSFRYPLAKSPVLFYI